jgi:hypothetical protein
MHLIQPCIFWKLEIISGIYEDDFLRPECGFYVNAEDCKPMEFKLRM